MVIAPHEDDELCILSGAIEEFSRYGSKIHIVFVTNGDYNGMGCAEQRMREVEQSAALCGVDPDSLIFLGYGDGWQNKHIFFGENNEVCISHAGADRTYGSSYKDAYNNGNLYTRDNLLNDMKSVVLEYKPDIIFACDNDYHLDHVCTSLIFEEAMGSILKENTDYRPIVLKAFAYFTAYYGIKDFYDDINILSTARFPELEKERPEYLWDARVRIPVSGSGLSRVLRANSTYEALAFNKSQSAELNSQNMINGDKVFWQRRTDSLCSAAEISTSSGEGKYLTDFKIGEPAWIRDGQTSYGVWSPDDAEKSCTITFAQPSDVKFVLLYDSKDKNSNVLEAKIEFDDGSSFTAAPLNADGSAARIDVNVRNVGSMKVTLVDTEGETAGLTEIEAFSTEEQKLPEFIKLMDKDGNFAYEWCIDESGSEDMLLYSNGGVKLSECEVTFSGSGKAEVVGEVLRVSCPENGDECTVTVTAPDGSMSDTVHFINADFSQYFRQTVEDCAENYRTIYWRFYSYRVLRDIYHLFGGQNIVF